MVTTQRKSSDTLSNFRQFTATLDQSWRFRHHEDRNLMRTVVNQPELWILTKRNWSFCTTLTDFVTCCFINVQNQYHSCFKFVAANSSQQRNYTASFVFVFLWRRKCAFPISIMETKATETYLYTIVGHSVWCQYASILWPNTTNFWNGCFQGKADVIFTHFRKWYWGACESYGQSGVLTECRE